MSSDAGATGCLVVLGLLGGGAYYAYYKLEASAEAEAERRRNMVRAPLVECLAFISPPPLDQPYLDAVLKQCVKACRSSDVWRYEEGPTHDRRGNLCLRTGLTLRLCNQETYLSANPNELIDEGCKYRGILPSKCRERYDEAMQPWPDSELVPHCTSLERERRTASSIASIGYSAKERVLDVVWDSGELYRALKVPPEFYRRFVEAEYPAGFFSLQTKNAGYRVVSLTVD